MPRIVIVDDEVDLANYLAEELRDLGWQTSTAHNGVDAVLRVMDGGWQLVLMDFRMPKLDGINALQIFRRLNPALPVIMFTGQAGQGEMLEANRLGAFTCLAKPVALETLLKTLHSAIGTPVH